MKKICVLGSLNVDLVVRLPRFHVPGETISALDFSTFTGGKGGNQAVAAARLGADVMLAGMLGDDEYGALYRRVLDREGIDARAVQAVASTSSGLAVIEVDERGENRIAIVPGANALVDRALVDRLMPQLLNCDIFLLQLEIPMGTVCYAAEVLHAAGKCVILDPAPAVPLPDALLICVDYLTPNATELALLSGLPTDTDDQVERAARALIKRGAHCVVAKLGERGCLCVTADSLIPAPGFTVRAIDTTAAGDSFNAGLAVALAQGKTVPQALRFANAVGALSTTGAGAQGAMPNTSRVDAFLNE